ncbi:MAG: hypothetical protein GEU98_20650 [Pseudonocardiaceae bacterium]|nr:hypothetical protein [Pseudonocardiaceae bacterium]
MPARQPVMVDPGPLWWQVVQVVTALTILAACGLAGLVLLARRRRAERARQARIRAVLSGWMPDHPTVADLQHRIAQETNDEQHYGRHALRAGHGAPAAADTGRVPVQRDRTDADTRRLPVVSRTAALRLAGQVDGGRW